MLKKAVKKIIKGLGYDVIKSNPERKKVERFSLNTGERQVGTKLEEIRRDHVARYEKSAEILHEMFDSTENLFGGDIFCGNGYGSQVITNKNNCFMLGFDASQDAINLANNHYANEKMFFVEKKFPFFLPENVFDFVISFETIEHLEQDKELVTQFSKSLKKDGLLFLSAPNEEICSFEKNNYEFHIKHYTFNDMVDLLCKENSFELVNWYGNGAHNFQDGLLIDKRDDADMELKEKVLDGHLIYVFRKK